MPTELLRIRKRDGSSNYQLQLAVPADLRQHFNGSRYIRLSLGTGDKALAHEKARSVALPYWQKFCDLRERPQAQAHSLNQEQFLAESLAYLKDRASAESRRIAQLIAEGEEEARAFAEQSWDAAHDSLWDDINPEGGKPPHKRLESEENCATAGAVLARLGLSLEALNSTDRTWALREVESLRLDLYVIMEECCAQVETHKARARIYRRRSDALGLHRPIQNIGDAQAQARHTLPAGRSATPPNAKTLRDVVPFWVKTTSAKPNAIQRMEYALTLWEDAVGDIALSQITRATGSDFVLYLLDDDREFGSKTAKNHASNINALMNKAAERGDIDANPLRMKFGVDDSLRRTPWTDEELQLLHGVPITGPQPKDVDPVDADLLLSMFLWSGARISELTNLRLQDVQDRDGILAAYIRRETTKNDASVRWLPIAGAIRERVKAHMRQRQEEGSSVLFPSFHKRPCTPVGDFAGRWFREHRERLGLPQGPLFGSHKWRHTVRTKLAGKGIGEALLDAVTGHMPAAGSAGRKNYTHADRFPLANVLSAIELLDWPWPPRSSP